MIFLGILMCTIVGVSLARPDPLVSIAHGLGHALLHSVGEYDLGHHLHYGHYHGGFYSPFYQGHYHSHLDHFGHDHHGYDHFDYYH